MKPLLLLFTLLLSSPSLAQFRLGVTGGLNISKLTVGDDSYKGYVDDIQPGFFVGPTVVYTHPKIGLGLDASALFDQRGAKSENIKDTKSIYCRSFQFPLHLRYGINYENMVYAFVFTGPQWGVNVGSKERAFAEGTGAATGHALERRWVHQASTFSWNFGLGAVVMENVQVRVSYNLALRKTATIQQVDLLTGSSRVITDGKAHACQVALSYLF